ncbi:MAG: glycogen-debranching protein, partial [Actinobacteria bacterium]|nr:glycogen-debranching protein [Actinomycetota bacterium]
MRTIRLGQPWPLGSSATDTGVNFSLVAPMATRVELLIFPAGNAPEPDQVVELDHHHRSGDIWHVEVEGLGIGCCYAYRVFGPLQPGRHGFNPSKLLLDP